MMKRMIARLTRLGGLAALVLISHWAWAATPEVFYVHNDQLGTPRAVVDGNNVEVWRREGDAYGEQPPEQDPSGTGQAFVFNLRYPGQYYDVETGRMYNGWRDYDPSTGRYVQSDPLGLEGGQWSTYAYVGGSPVSYSDQEGLAVFICSRAADLPWPLSKVHHQWIKTDTVEAGMGATPGVIPGQRNIDLPFTPTQVVNHSGQSTKPNASCEKAPPKVDEQCVNAKLRLGRETGRWAPWNQCQSFVKDVIAECTK
ncbi:hypothetical protein JOS77_18705 [Chromobacterium haemolyticum]|nr:hypothetical protein JOS77_18705 [Chromobacterium haemolyticum]